jgi:hypothetical protein
VRIGPRIGREERHEKRPEDRGLGGGGRSGGGSRPSPPAGRRSSGGKARGSRLRRSARRATGRKPKREGIPAAAPEARERRPPPFRASARGAFPAGEARPFPAGPSRGISAESPVFEPPGARPAPASHAAPRSSAGPWSAPAGQGLFPATAPGGKTPRPASEKTGLGKTIAGHVSRFIAYVRVPAPNPLPDCGRIAPGRAFRKAGSRCPDLCGSPAGCPGRGARPGPPRRAAPALPETDFPGCLNHSSGTAPLGRRAARPAARDQRAGGGNAGLRAPASPAPTFAAPVHSRAGVCRDGAFPRRPSLARDFPCGPFPLLGLPPASPSLTSHAPAFPSPAFGEFPSAL